MVVRSLGKVIVYLVGKVSKIEMLELLLQMMEKGIKGLEIRVVKVDILCKFRKKVKVEDYVL